MKEINDGSIYIFSFICTQKKNPMFFFGTI